MASPFSTITIPNNVSVIPVDTRGNSLKVLYLPTVSTNQGRFLMFKDYYGTAATSSFTISTTGTDLIDDYNCLLSFSNAFGSVSLLADGGISWRTIGMYDGLTTPIAPTSGLDPTTIAGGILWLDASRFTQANNTIVNTWPSATPSYSLSMTGTGTINTGVLNGLPVMFVPTNQDWTLSNSNYTSASYTFFFVSRQTGGANGRVFIGNGNVLYGYWGGYKNCAHLEGWVAGPSVGSDTNWDIYTFVRTSSGSGSFWRYGVNISTYGSSGSALNGFYINTGGCCGNEKSNSQIAEVIIYNIDLSMTNINKIEGYLAWKWGLQANLPSNHPHKSAPP